MAMGSNFLLKDEKLAIAWDDLLFPIQKNAQAAWETRKKLEPAKNSLDKKEVERLYDRNPVLLRGRDSNPYTQLQRLLSYR